MNSDQIEQEIMDADRYLVQLGILNYTVRDKRNKDMRVIEKCFTEKFLKHYLRCKHRMYQALRERYPREYHEVEEFDNLDASANYNVILTFLGLFTEKELEGTSYDEYN